MDLFIQQEFLRTEPPPKGGGAKFWLTDWRAQVWYQFLIFTGYEEQMDVSVKHTQHIETKEKTTNR